VDGRVEVRADAGAVAPDVSEHDRRGAGGVGARGDLVGSGRSVAKPALDRDPAVAEVDADGDPAGPARARTLRDRRIERGSGAEDRALRAGIEHARERVEIAQAAADLHRNRERGTDAGDQRPLRPRASRRAVEVDDMEPRRALARPALGHRDRIVAVRGLRREVALHEAHAAAAPEVDRRDRFEAAFAHAGTATWSGRSAARTKLARIFKPTSWLFSGWNWVAKRASRATAAVNSSPPYSAVAATIAGSDGSA